ncbi:hypothetical protein [Candidatus Rariloculus sp.]|uniref:hypothetical protein n=1 Tax=Candidatus Rariloculus sp. TaxID=3101265 RepID=UPI003D10ABCB
MALDRVNNQLFVPAYGNGGFRAFQLTDDGLLEDRRARFITSRTSLIGRRSVPLPSARESTFPGANGLFDSTTERFFTIDRFANRILVYDASRDQLRNFPAAEVVIGQPDFTSTQRGLGPNRMGAVGSAAVDEAGQRLFVPDGPNNRVLVFDIRPDVLTNDPRAVAVIGQPDFESRDPGIGPSGLTGPASVAYDPVFERLFVSDARNNRVLIFDADPDNPDAFASAVAVMGQPDFMSRAPRESLDELEAEALAYDSEHHRLFIAEDLEHRIMVYDAHPDRVGGPARAIAVIGQPDAFSTHPAVSQTRVAMPRATVDSETQKLYVSEGYPAGNRVAVFDISPENLATGMPAVDVIGHETPDGEPDFNNRMAQGRLDGRSLAAARAVVLDPADHRLFVPDEYNHRVVVWQLDELNRIMDDDARWVLGQPDLNTSLMGEPTARNMTVPIGGAYDTSTQRLFIGDGYHNRILVYEAAPGTLESGMAASVVIGQPDFESVARQAGRTGINFDVRMGRGIASDFLPMGFAVDESGQRLFVSDGANNRILIYDIRRSDLGNGAAAIGVIGQADYDSTSVRPGALGIDNPGHLAYDAETERLFAIDAGRRTVLVFDVDPGRFDNGQGAIAVIGSDGFDTPAPAGGGPFAAVLGTPRPIDGASFVTPNGIAHDPLRQLVYVADGGGTFGVPTDRILVFNVASEDLENGAEAIAVLGAPAAETAAARAWGGAEPVPGQFRVRDTRGIDLDYENGRLWATGSFESRVVAFNFPRAAWNYRIAGNAMQSFSTLDASDLGGQSEPRTVAALRVDSGSGIAPSAMLMYSSSRQTVDEASQRHSRRLINEAAIAPSAPVSRATIFVDGGPDRGHTLHFYNPESSDSNVALVVRDRQGLVIGEWQRTVPAGEQLTVELETMGGPIPAAATVAIDANRPVALTALRTTTNGRGEDMLAPAPLALGSGPAERVVLPYFVGGGDRQSSVILINPTDDVMTGRISFHDPSGARAVLGTDSDVVDYRIPPYGSRVVASHDTGPRARRGYVAVTADQGGAPHSAALIVRSYGGVVVSESTVTGTSSDEARFAVDLGATLIRHGEIDTQLVVVNASADVTQFEVSSGTQTIAMRELAPGEQTVLSVRALAGAGANGVFSVTGDDTLVVAARQETTNIRAEQVDVELPPLSNGAFAPYVVNGAGIATEIRLANGSSERIAGTLTFLQPDGEPATGTILR